MAITVKQLIIDLKKAVDKDHSILDKQILLSDDDEGNGYHEMCFTITANENDVKECVECSNGISSIETNDYSNYVILG